MTIPGREENIDTLKGFISPDADVSSYVEEYTKKKLKSERLSMFFLSISLLVFVDAANIQLDGLIISNGILTITGANSNIFVRFGT